MAEHCTQCRGTGKVKTVDTFDLVACLHCTGTGIEPEEKTTPTRQHIIGPFNTYRGMKRDAMIIVGLVIIWLVLNGTIF